MGIGTHGAAIFTSSCGCEILPVLAFSTQLLVDTVKEVSRASFAGATSVTIAFRIVALGTAVLTPAFRDQVFLTATLPAFSRGCTAQAVLTASFAATSRGIDTSSIISFGTVIFAGLGRIQVPVVLALFARGTRIAFAARFGTGHT